jgi:hypothetical protein
MWSQRNKEVNVKNTWKEFWWDSEEEDNNYCESIKNQMMCMSDKNFNKFIKYVIKKEKENKYSLKVELCKILRMQIDNPSFNIQKEFHDILNYYDLHKYTENTNSLIKESLKVRILSKLFKNKVWKYKFKFIRNSK